MLHQIGRGVTLEHFETVYLTKAGRPIDVSVAVSAITAANGEIVGVAKIVRHIGNRLRAEEARGRLAAIVDSSDDAIVSKTLEASSPPGTARPSGSSATPAAEAIGQSILFIVPSDRRDEERRSCADPRRRVGRPLRDGAAPKDGTLLRHLADRVSGARRARPDHRRVEDGA